MQYKFSTLSGSEYLIDTDKMTWQRRNPRTGHEAVGGWDANAGTLYDVPEVRIGERCDLQVGRGLADYIRTTRVARIEALDYPEVD